MSPAADDASEPAWRVSLTTVDETLIRVTSRSRGSEGPWPLMRVLAGLSPLGVRPNERFRALGSGRGAPLVHSLAATWCGLPVELEAVVDHRGTAPAEVSLGLPSHREMLHYGGPDEGAFWELVDAFAASADAEHGAILDGEAMSLDRPADAAGWEHRFSHHFCLLVPERDGHLWPPALTPYRLLPSSRLVVVLR